MADKPSLQLHPADLSEEEVLEMFKALTGREPTDEEIEELKAAMAEGDKEE